MIAAKNCNLALHRPMYKIIYGSIAQMVNLICMSKSVPKYTLHNMFYLIQRRFINLNNLGAQSLSVHKFDIGRAEYRRKTMSLGIDTEESIRILLFTCLTGGLMTINVRCSAAIVTANDATRIADRLHIVLNLGHIHEHT